jgi:hypothetical protein
VRGLAPARVADFIKAGGVMAALFLVMMMLMRNIVF